MNNMDIIKEQLKESLDAKKMLLEDEEQLGIIEQIVELIIGAYKSGKKVIFMGNGGSAADSQHLAAELVSKFQMERSALAAVALTVNTSVLTAIGNDYGYERVFLRQVEALVNKGDVVFGISTSGSSQNVVLALEKAKEMGASTVGLTGEKEGKISEIADVTFKAKSNNTPRVQETHVTVGHIICSLVEKGMFTNE